ncbi:MAG: type I 3-dehydroquinate dehydratase [Nitrosopumilaceae archaeon]|nr:type I 3-dehydroquinate dehydratase [Nitrosopumilaceae archaeon]
MAAKRNRYSTCVSVARGSPAAMRKALLEALRRSEYAEARLDYMRPDDVPGLLGSLPPDLLRRRIVCTVRNRRDGGRFEGQEGARYGMLDRVAAYRPFMLDVEYDALKRSRRLAGALHASGTRLLVSWHSFVRTPSPDALRRRMQEMFRYSDHVKLACMAKDADESIRMLELYRWIGREGADGGRRTLISFAMGDAGRLTRVLCMQLGSPYAYVSLGRAVAPGQLSLGEFRRLGRVLK